MTPSGSQLFSKVSGNLEKKGRIRIGSLWKKYWFVLEGRLLLYYRSKDEYEAISPCKGSINLCPPCTIKPAAATSCVFQIIGRATTVTLRAESRFEQERWMQALLTAIDQSKSSPSRLSHFRYSLDELPMPYQDEVPENGLQRQHSMSYNSTPRCDINRLQLIGAQPFGGSLDTFAKHASVIQQIELYKNKHNNKSGSNTSNLRQNELIVENDQYSIIQEENSLDVLMDGRNTKTKSLEYLQASKSLSKLNERHSLESQLNHPKGPSIRNNKLKKSESLYERVSGDYSRFGGNAAVKIRRKHSNIYERISSGSLDSEKQIKIHGQYSVVKKISRELLHSLKEPEYSLPKTFEDHNKNSLIIENEQYLPSVTNAIENEYYKVDPVKELEQLYEDPDVLHKSIEKEPALPPRPDLKKQDSINNERNSVEETKKRSKGLQLFSQLLKSDKKEETPRPKKKRSTSFIHKMLRRKEKPENIITEVVNVVEEVAENGVEKQKDVNDLQMLHELQKILEARKRILQKKLNIADKEDSESATIKTAAKVNNFEHKKKDVDEIIDDLEKEKGIQDSNRKVKDLIVKFNDLRNEDEILLRKKSRTSLQRSESVGGVPQTFYKIHPRVSKRDSDELGKLLEELSKVTSAPVLPPGVTCSLTTPIIQDEEVVPIRYRRLSDPDYDIPRPHRSLQLQNRTKDLQGNSIPATRFFGPVLAPGKTSSEAHSLTSMDPDSLEIEQISNKIQNIKPQMRYTENNGSISSYNSHNYSKLDDIIYLQPKSLLFNLKIDSQKAGENKHLSPTISTVTEETFIDSLEPQAESTHF